MATQSVKKMQKMRRKQLAEFIRAKKYTKLKGRLTRGQGKGKQFCVMGVACEMYREHTQQGEWKDGDFIDENGSQGGGALPPSVMEWYGFNNPVGTFVNQETGQADSLVNLNDHTDKGLEDLAKIIEDEPKGLV